MSPVNRSEKAGGPREQCQHGMGFEHSAKAFASPFALRCRFWG